MPRVKIAPPRRPQRRRPPTGLLTWPPTPQTLRLAAVSASVAILLGSAVYMWRAGVPTAIADAFDSVRTSALVASAAAGLKVQEIFIEGRGETPGQHVLDVLNVKRGTPILAFSPAAAKAELEQLPWVKEASVERRLPDTILVRIVERRPLALWQHGRQLVVIDHDGTEISGADPAKFAGLPLVVGDDAPKHANQLLALMALEPDLEKRVIAAIRVGARRWNLQMDAGEGVKVDVQLPEVNAGAAWARLAELERSNRLLDRSVSVIDLRFPDRLIVRAVRETPPPAPPRTRTNKPT
ncbi:MAG TPA: FtsQ-type POTRA domain-containing protein [Alphaproteobacteria bacterium]|nr:FtsQ-type POTRA domain-containing protein [Alphaproteobacteria bacterium]